jgi:hypothetical protein
MEGNYFISVNIPEWLMAPSSSYPSTWPLRILFRVLLGYDVDRRTSKREVGKLVKG